MNKLNGFVLEKNPRLHMTYGKKENKKFIEEIIFTYKKKPQGATKDDIIQTIKKIQKQAQAKQSEYNHYIVSLKYDNGWRSGKMFSIYDDKPNLFDVDEYIDNTGQNKYHNINLNQKYFKAFSIYKIPIPVKGGCTKNKHNDCLFYCIKDVIGLENINVKMNTPTKLKSNLKLKRDDKISINLIPQVEVLMSLNISVSGENTYLSNGNYSRTVNIIMQDEHYTVDTSKKIKKCLVKPTSKPVVFFRIHKDKETKAKTIQIVSNDKNETFHYTADFIMEYKKNNNVYMIKDKNNSLQLDESFKQYQESAKFLKEHTKGFIDLYKYPEPSVCALYLLHCFSKAVEEPEEITSIETTFIKNSFQGGLMYSDDGEYENATCIDQNSMYAFYMSSDKFLIPTSQGELKNMTEDEFNNLKFFPVGIYRCIIESTNIDLNRLFRFNKTNYYTYNDLNLAKVLKFNIKIITGNGYNALIYNSLSRIQGSKMYKSLIDYLYKLKLETKDKYIKKIISSSWGSQCEILKYTTKVNYDNEIHIDKSIIDIHKYEDAVKVICADYEKYFKTNYARLGTFLTSFCRLNLAKTILSTVKNINNIKRIHTDSFTTVNEEYEHLLGSEIGKFKIEHIGNCKIQNVCNVEWI